jgi:hypothetical protein
MSIDITDAERSRLFGHSGGWAPGMITRHLHEITSVNPIARGRPRLVESEGEQTLIQFCLKRQAEKRPASVEDFIEFMGESGVQIDRFWVDRFVERNSATLILRQATYLGQDRHAVVADDLKRYFDCASHHLKTIPSQFVWNADETRVGAPKKQKAPRVIV